MGLTFVPGMRGLVKRSGRESQGAFSCGRCGRECARRTWPYMGKALLESVV